MLLSITRSAFVILLRSTIAAIIICVPMFAEADSVHAPVFSDSEHSKVIYLDLSDQTAFLFEDGMPVAMLRISSGAPATPTPRGEFKIWTKQELRISSLDLPYRMPYYMALAKDGAFGLHALPYLGNSAEDSWYWQEALEHIGKPVSHGCVRFLPADAASVYAWADVGTPVIIRS